MYYWLDIYSSQMLSLNSLHNCKTTATLAKSVKGGTAVGVRASHSHALPSCLSVSCIHHLLKNSNYAFMYSCQGCSAYLLSVEDGQLVSHVGARIATMYHALVLDTPSVVSTVC